MSTDRMIGMAYSIPSLRLHFGYPLPAPCHTSLYDMRIVHLRQRDPHSELRPFVDNLLEVPLCSLPCSSSGKIWIRATNEQGVGVGSVSYPSRCGD
jgi:hypothetical protein